VPTWWAWAATDAITEVPLSTVELGITTTRRDIADKSVSSLKEFSLRAGDERPRRPATVVQSIRASRAADDTSDGVAAPTEGSGKSIPTMTAVTPPWTTHDRRP